MPDLYRALLLALLPLVACGDKDPEDTAGDGGAADGGAADGGAGDGGAGDGGVATESELGCLYLEDAEAPCPAPADVPLEQVTPETCGAEVISVDGEGSSSESCGWIGGFAPAGWCVYPITVIPPEEECDYGRPLVVDGAPRLAPLVRREGWTDGAPGGEPAGGDQERAAAWARVALAEHASVASFHRHALELLALGAPAALVQRAQEAARDELRHARLAFDLASALAGVPLGPGPLPLGELGLAPDLAALAASTARDGCVAETLSALQVALARDRAADPRERAVLAVLARDEQRHAALAWQVLRWAIDAGGAPVRAAVATAFAAAFAAGPGQAGGSALLPPEVARAAVQRGWEEVIRPAAAALLDGAPGHEATA